MTPRENVLRLLRRQGYDQAPNDFSLCPHLLEMYRRQEHTTLPYEEYFSFPWRRLPGLTPHDQDRSRFEAYHEVLDQDTTLDIWGVGHRKTPTSMHMTQMLFPLGKAETLQDIQDYPYPAFREEDNRHLPGLVQKHHDAGLAVIGDMQCTIWESAWYMRGMENLMSDMVLEPDMAAALLNRVEQIATDKARLYVQAGADILFLGDDIGMQHTIMMSEALYSEWLKPALARVIATAKKINPSLIVMYHSCGYVEPFIPHLMEVGVDVLNPLQPECMDFEKIHAQYGNRLSFYGTLGTQSTMPFGTAQEVRDTVFRHLDIAGEKGGLFVAPTHLLEPEVPWENVLAYVQANNDYKG